MSARLMVNRGLLDSGFFERSVLEVAPDLLRCCICCTGEGGKATRLQITEVEAYDGPHDRACHAHKGRTSRTEVMFGPAGVWYIYLCYGVHWMMNIVTGPVDYPAAVLIRGAGQISGPGRLTRRLGIDGTWNGKTSSPDSGLWIERGDAVAGRRILRTARIGIDYAGPDWANRPYRYVVE